MIVRYLEDLLVLNKWLVKLIKLHFSKYNSWADIKKPIEIKSHCVTVDGKEVDLLITNGEIKVLVELKNYDMYNVVRQALERRKYADYVYVCLNLPAYTIIKELKKYEEALKSGIVISAEDECIVLRAYPQRRHHRKVKPVRDRDAQIINLLEGDEE